MSFTGERERPSWDESKYNVNQTTSFLESLKLGTNDCDHFGRSFCLQQQLYAC